MRHHTRSQLEAGIVTAGLQDDYERARQLNAAHGKTYYLIGHGSIRLHVRSLVPASRFEAQVTSSGVVCEDGSA
jgi:hypothetical protein